MFKAKIKNEFITVYLKKEYIIDCTDGNKTIKGWFFFDKNKIKIPLDGFLVDKEIRVYNFHPNFKKSQEIFENKHTEFNTDELKDQIYWLDYRLEKIYQNSNPNYFFEFYDNNTGIYNKAGKKVKFVFQGNGIFFARHQEFFTLPNFKKIILDGWGFRYHKFLSLKKDKNENRILFYFSELPNPNACRRCGGGDLTEGYSILYFDKKWKFKKDVQHYFYFCRADIVSKKKFTDKNKIKYLIKEKNEFYNLEINKKNSTVKIIK